jgi:hypothetical protein
MRCAWQKVRILFEQAGVAIPEGGPTGRQARPFLTCRIVNNLGQTHAHLGRNQWAVERLLTNGPQNPDSLDSLASLRGCAHS